MEINIITPNNINTGRITILITSKINIVVIIQIILSYRIFTIKTCLMSFYNSKFPNFDEILIQEIKLKIHFNSKDKIKIYLFCKVFKNYNLIKNLERKRSFDSNASLICCTFFDVYTWSNCHTVINRV